MPRRRIRKEDSWLPTRVYRGHSSYQWIPKNGRSVSLCKLVRANGEIIEPPEVKRLVLEKYELAVQRTAQIKNVDYYLTKFVASRVFGELGDVTQSDYLRYIEILAVPGDDKTRNGIRSIFGKMIPSTVKPHHIRTYMDYWSKSGKLVTANRHLACLQKFFKYVRQLDAGIIDNPASSIDKFKEKSRAVYVSDEDYQKLLTTAIQSTRPYVAAVMEISYLCGLRRHEVLQLNMEDITEQGLFIRRGKGSKNEITEISPRLQKAIDFAISLHRNDKPEPLRNRPLIRSTRGDRVTKTAINTAWRMVREKAGLPDVWLHDMKKKAGTDGKDLGHMTKAMQAMYNLKPDVKKATK